ncbi:MAG: hypothetical protein IBX50_08790 [Marinospirillum sp.]|uniref:DUF6175 family protein n=1 Tax=Marinospirillum sp. TaxID=2183934 RepID=UPI0019E9EF58|nr:DUF6175 family protein [Marinospirillum sp.]MBE0506801.1 hypothetical protein [Marinospirillum sp.]
MLFRFTIYLLALLLLTGCASSKNKHPTPEPGDPPLSRQVVLVESYSAAELLVRTTGLGHSMATARDDARKAALWFVLLGSNNPLLADQTSQQAFRNHEKDLYTNVMQYITYESDVLSRREDNQQIRIERNYRINMDQLRADLISRGVISSITTLASQVSNPQISIITADSSQASTQAATVFAEYLQRRGFQVVVVEASRAINKQVQQAAALSGTLDPSYLLALQTGSDIYIALDNQIATRNLAGTEISQSAVTATAYYTATSAQLGAATGYSSERAVAGSGAISGEAANDAASKLLGQISRSWQQEATQGRSFKVVASATPEMGDISRPIHQLFNQVCHQVRRNAAGSSSFDYILTCKTRDVMDLLFELEDNWRGPGKIFRVMDSGAFLIIKVGYTDSDDIIIQ